MFRRKVKKERHIVVAHVSDEVKEQAIQSVENMRPDQKTEILKLAQEKLDKINRILQYESEFQKVRNGQ